MISLSLAEATHAARSDRAVTMLTGAAGRSPAPFRRSRSEPKIYRKLSAITSTKTPSCPHFSLTDARPGQI